MLGLKGIYKINGQHRKISATKHDVSQGVKDIPILGRQNEYYYEF